MAVPEEDRRMTIAEFRELGLLQEINRLLLHPMGLALSIQAEDLIGNVKQGTFSILDYRDDPEGMVYNDANIDPVKIENVANLTIRKSITRMTSFGWVIQPSTELSYIEEVFETLKRAGED